MFGIWDVQDVGVWDVGCSGCGVFGCGMFRTCDVQDVGSLGCGMFGMRQILENIDFYNTIEIIIS